MPISVDKPGQLWVTKHYINFYINQPSVNADYKNVEKDTFLLYLGFVKDPKTEKFFFYFLGEEILYFGPILVPNNVRVEPHFYLSKDV